MRGLAVDGFGGAWYLCTVSLGGKRSHIDVICTDFVEDDGQPVVDRVDKSRMRPLPPQGPGLAVSVYAVGSQVDVLNNDCWWEAVLLGVEGDEALVKINSARPGLRGE